MQGEKRVCAQNSQDAGKQNGFRAHLPDHSLRELDGMLRMEEEWQAGVQADQHMQEFPGGEMSA